MHESKAGVSATADVAEWVKAREGENLKFKHETLLNYALNRWGLNKAHSVGPTSELIRQAQPRSIDEWTKYYFQNAVQKKRDGHRIDPAYLKELGKRLHANLSTTVSEELSAITKEECIGYVFNLIVNRTWEGYRSEIETVCVELKEKLQTTILPAPDAWDRGYNVDYYIPVEERSIGIQVKPITSGRALNQYQWEEMHRGNHERFQKDHGGKVFFVFSVKKGKKKVIHNPGVIQDIRLEMERLTASL